MRKTIYLVVPCYNEELVIQEAALKLKGVMNGLIQEGLVAQNSKICFVNDGSKDLTWKFIKDLIDQDSIFAGINLTRNFGHQNALLAGMSAIKDECDAVITIDADLQQEVSAIKNFILAFYDGDDIVYGIRKGRTAEKFSKRKTGEYFYKLMNIMGVKLKMNHTDYRLMSKSAIVDLLRFKEVNLFLRGIVPLIGYDSSVVYYDQNERFAGETKYTLNKMMSLAVNGITSLTIIPLRVITFIGFFIFISSIITSCFFLIAHLINKTVPGWTSIVLSIWLIGGLQLLSIGIIGEYIGKTYLETKGRPRYIIREIVGLNNTGKVMRKFSDDR